MKEYTYTPNDANASQVLFKILQETQNGKMIWASNVLTVGIDGNYERADGLAFCSSLHGSPIRIYKLYNSYFNTYRYIMELYNPNDNSVSWRFPENDNIILDIYRAIGEKYNSMQDLFNSYLSE